MNVLVDTNILTPTAEPKHTHNAAAVQAVRTLLERGDTLHIVPQNIYEFWVVATRPITSNGLGMTPAQAAGKLDELAKVFALLPDTASILPEWRRVVLAGDCRGKIAHDARLVAAMRVHGLDRILTFNTKDFSRFPGLHVLDPQSIVQQVP